jgi:hypothetical protein
VDPLSSDAVLVKALSNEVVSVIRDLVKANPLFREQTQYFTARVDLGDPFKLADFAASLTTAEGPELQVRCEPREHTLVGGGERGGRGSCDAQYISASL